VCQNVGGKYNFVIGEQEKVEFLMVSNSLSLNYLTSPSQK
jgi:hypothetical protein